MRVAFVITVLSVLVVPHSAVPQGWREAYDRSDHARAADLLHAEVLQRDHDQRVWPSVAATIQLANMYLTGTGVTADRIRACGLLFVAARAQGPPNPLVPNPLAARLREEHCSSLSYDESNEGIVLAANCFNYGLEPQVFVLDPGYSVEINRRGITIHHEGKNHFTQILNNTAFCAQQIPEVRYTRVDPPPTAEGRAARHLVEFFAWKSNRNGGQLRRTLDWHLWEVLGHQWQFRKYELLLQDDRSAWPPSEIPEEFRRVTFRMRRNGQVLWQFSDSTVKGGLEALPETVEPDEFPPIEPGNGRIDVTVTGQFGAPMTGVLVALNGLVSSSLQTNSAGEVTFTDLPDGRYDVFGSRKGSTARGPAFSIFLGRRRPSASS